MSPCHGDPVATIDPNFSERILALRPAVCTARIRRICCVELASAAVNVSEQLDTVSPTCLTTGTVSEQPGQGIGTVAWNINSTYGVVSYISMWYFKRLSCIIQTDDRGFPTFLLLHQATVGNVSVVFVCNDVCNFCNVVCS